MTDRLCAEPLDVAAEQGALVVEGCGAAVTMTPDAAVETADRLLDEAAVAIGKQKMADVRYETLQIPRPQSS